MRCITLNKSETKGTDGIRLQKRGNRYIVWNMGVNAMAQVSIQDFAEMVQRGHASNDPRIERVS